MSFYRNWLKFLIKFEQIETVLRLRIWFALNYGTLPLPEQSSARLVQFWVE